MFLLRVCVLYQLLSALSPQQRVTCTLLGIDPGRVDLWRLTPPSAFTRQSLQYLTYERFYATLVLHEYLLWEELEILVRVAEGIDKSATTNSRALGTDYAVSRTDRCALCPSLLEVCCSSCPIPLAPSVT